MKYLVLFGVLFAAYLVWRAGRTGDAAGPRSGPDAAGTAARRRPPAAAPQDMVSCAVCGLHLPRDEALSDARGRTFCSPEHRDQAA